MHKTLKFSVRLFLASCLLFLSLKPNATTRLVFNHLLAAQAHYSTTCRLGKNLPAENNHRAVRCSFGIEDKRTVVSVLITRYFIDSSSLVSGFGVWEQTQAKIAAVPTFHPVILRI